MHEFGKLAGAVLLATLVAACATPGPGPGSGGQVSQPSRPPAQRPPVANVPPTDPQPSVPGAFIAPRVMNDPGLAFVIGSRASELEKTFGPARLDVMEGDVRKLQFVGNACVLDVFLYPLRPGAEPTATYVDARRSSDALDVDRADCAQALRR